MHKIKLDATQSQIWQRLESLADNIQNQQSSGFFAKILGKKHKTQPKSLYLYSKPGRGKTLLMQKFYDKLQKTPKVYFHFNSFMREIHESLRDIRAEEKQYKDELIEATKRIIQDKKVLCFDEFQVHDIADSMILGRIFSYLFSQNVIVILTSNSKPQDLYKNGLQREIFLEFVDNTLLKNIDLIKFDDDIDYRMQYKKNLAKRYFVLNEKNRTEVNEIIENLTKSKALKPRTIKVWGRDVIIKKTYENIAVIDFAEICKVDFGAADYREICQEFSLIFLLKLPILTSQDRNEARRFMLFIDEIYENKTALIILAKAKIDKIFEDEKDKIFHARTISRLNEIKSDFYWQNAKFNLLT